MRMIFALNAVEVESQRHTPSVGFDLEVQEFARGAQLELVYLGSLQFLHPLLHPLPHLLMDLIPLCALFRSENGIELRHCFRPDRQRLSVQFSLL